MRARLGHVLRGFPHAVRGLARLVRTERHARFHLATTGAVVAIAVVLRVTLVEALALTLAIGGVWTAEAFNSALERLADRVTREHDPLIGEAKDLAAGAVLASACAALVVGLLVFGSRAIELFAEH
jgi:diacylglycerol kinase